MKSTLPFLITLLFIATLSFAQEPVVEEEPVFEDMSVEEDYSSGEVAVFDKTLSDSRIQFKEMKDGYSWFFDRSVDSYSKKYGLAYNGKVILPMIFNKDSYDNQMVAKLGINKIYGIYDVKSRKWLIPIEYGSLQKLGYADMYVASRGGLYGVVDQSNREIVPFEWGSISHYGLTENYLKVKDPKSNTHGIYSLIARKLVIPCDYSTLESHGSGFLVTQNGKKNIVSINNVAKFRTWYDELIKSNKGQKRYIVKKDNMFGIIDDKEKTIVPFEYTEIRSSPFNDGSYLAKNRRGKFGCMLLDGTITLPFEYDDLKYNYSNNIISKGNNKCGIVQVNNGKPFEIATCDYDDIQNAQTGFIIKQNGKFGLMDKHGELIQPIVWDALRTIGSSSSYSSNSKGYLASKNGMTTMLNEEGTEILQKKFKEIYAIPEISKDNYSRKYSSFLKVQDASGKYGVMDKLGSIILEAQFEDIVGESKNKLLVIKNGKYGLYDMLTRLQEIEFEYDQLLKNGDSFIGIKGSDFYTIDLQPTKKVTKL